MTNREKALIDFEDSLKEKCERCGRWDIVDQYGFCDLCSEDNDAYFDEYFDMVPFEKV